MIHLEPGHRVVGETIAARLNAPPDKREAVDVRAADFDDVQYHVQVAPEDRNTMHVHVWVRGFKEINDAVGDEYFQELYPGMLAKPAKGYSLSLAVNLDTVPTDKASRGARTPAHQKHPHTPPTSRTPPRLPWCSAAAAPPFRGTRDPPCSPHHPPAASRDSQMRWRAS